MPRESFTAKNGRDVALQRAELRRIQFSSKLAQTKTETIFRPKSESSFLFLMDRMVFIKI